ncbi:ubiquitin carboxyl-terminal hydrolase 17-like protein 6 [Mantella aurantiaca]
MDFKRESMNIVNKLSPVRASCQSQPSSGDTDTSSPSLCVASASAEPSLGPVPGAAIYSPSSVPEKSEPSEQNDPSLALPGDGVDAPERIIFPMEKIQLKWQQFQNVGAGLQNLGNTCFVNSVLQCLTYTAPLANYMLSREHSKTCEDQGFCMMCVMQSHIAKALSNTGNVIKPMDVLNNLKHIASHFRLGTQEDAHEFLRYAVDEMQRSCLGDYFSNDITPEATFIQQVFGGCLRSRIQCLKCRTVSDKYEDFLDLALEIKSSHNINHALEEFVKAEELEGDNAYKCSKCNELVSASKTLSLHRTSNVLTLALKRFESFNGGKLSKDIKYAEYFDISPYTSDLNGQTHMYQLYAILVHRGTSCYSGHYFCYVKASDDQWYKLNDTIVSRVDMKTVLNQQPYLLFYIRSQNVASGDGSCAQQSASPNSPQPSCSQRDSVSKSSFAETQQTMKTESSILIAEDPEESKEQRPQLQSEKAVTKPEFPPTLKIRTLADSETGPDHESPGSSQDLKRNDHYRSANKKYGHSDPSSSKHYQLQEHDRQYSRKRERNDDQSSHCHSGKDHSRSKKKHRRHHSASTDHQGHYRKDQWAGNSYNQGWSQHQNFKYRSHHANFYGPSYKKRKVSNYINQQQDIRHSKKRKYHPDGSSAEEHQRGFKRQADPNRCPADWPQGKGK